jgi:hypothetical protein
MPSWHHHDTTHIQLALAQSLEFTLPDRDAGRSRTGMSGCREKRFTGMISTRYSCRNLEGSTGKQRPGDDQVRKQLRLSLRPLACFAALAMTAGYEPCRSLASTFSPP